jgi:hypothetical protein
MIAGLMPRAASAARNAATVSGAAGQREEVALGAPCGESGEGL